MSAEIADWGVYEGIEGIKKFFLRVHRLGGERARIGTLHLHTLTTPVIEVAEDGKTAKAVWISPGVETAHDEKGRLRAYWAWCKYGVDFVKEDGKWRIWHFHVYPIFMTPYEQSPVEAPLTPGPRNLPDELKPDRPTTYFWYYSPTRKAENVPTPPDPYETWDERSVALVKKMI